LVMHVLIALFTTYLSAKHSSLVLPVFMFFKRFCHINFHVTTVTKKTILFCADVM